MIVRLLLLLVVFILSCAQPQITYKRVVEHVVLISIDGFRPEFYLSEKYNAPILKELARNGTYARGMESVFPSITYPAHASIATGVRPDKHGIYSNHKFIDNDWYWDSSYIRVPTIWDKAQARGLKVALIYWPTTCGTKVDFLVAERQSLRDVIEHSQKALMQELISAHGAITEQDVEDRERVDRFITFAATYIIKKYRPNLTLVHLINLDHVQHEFGPDAPEVETALSKMDENIRAIVQSLKEAEIIDKSCVLIVGDHGFASVKYRIAINTLFVKEGLIEMEGNEVKSWDAYCHVNGAQGAIYLDDERVKDKVLEVLKSAQVYEGKRLYRILDKARLLELGAHPDAHLAIVPEVGYELVSSLSGDFLRELNKVKGNHGYLANQESMYTGFIAYGSSIRSGHRLGIRSILDIAPTVSVLLDLGMIPVEGESIEIIAR